MFVTDSGIGLNTYRVNISSGGVCGTFSVLIRTLKKVGGTYFKNITAKKIMPKINTTIVAKRRRFIFVIILSQYHIFPDTRHISIVTIPAPVLPVHIESGFKLV